MNGLSVVHDVEQRSPEWFALRAGMLTASEFQVARGRVGDLDAKQEAYVNAILDGCSEADAKAAGGYKSAPTSAAIQRALSGLPVGDMSPGAKNLAFKKAIERLIGKPLMESWDSEGSKRGNGLEADAREEYQMVLGEMVHECGFITLQTDAGTFGASLDGAVGFSSGACEIKCFSSPAVLRQIMIEGDLSDVMDQIQGQIMVAQLQWVDLCLYIPEMRAVGSALWVRRVHRDDEYIAALARDLAICEAKIHEYVGLIRAQLAGRPDADAAVFIPLIDPVAPPPAPAPAPVRAIAPPPAAAGIKPIEFSL